MVKKIVKKFLKTLKAKKKIVKKELTLESIEAMPEDIQKERGYQHGEIQAMQEELEELREKLKPSKTNEEIYKFLHQKEDELTQKELSGILSLRGLFDTIKGGKLGVGKKRISLLNRNRTLNFGDLYDITFNQDGRIGFWVMEDGMPRQVIKGATLKNIFWTYEGLVYSAEKGLFELSLDEFGGYIDNPMTEEVNSIIMDANGKYNISHVDSKMMIAQLIDKERKINELYRYLGMAEKALNKVGFDVNLQKLFSKLNAERRKTAETLLTKYAKEGNEMIKHWKQVEGELVDKSHQIYIKNNQIEVLESVRTKIMAKLENVESGDKVDQAKKDILSYMEFLVGMATGKKISFTKMPEDEGKSPLQRKYDEMVSRKGGEEE